MLNYLFKDYHLSVFQKLRPSNTCNQVKSCTKHGRSDQSQRELTVALRRQTSTGFIGNGMTVTRKLNKTQWILPRNN